MLILEKLANWATIIGVILTVLSLLFVGCQIKLTNYELESPYLNVTTEIEYELGRINLTLTNNANHKEAGTINLYRVGISDIPYKNESSLEPKKSITITLLVDIVEKKFYKISNLTSEINNLDYMRDTLSLLPEDLAIAYEIKCDQCPQSIVGKLVPKESTPPLNVSTISNITNTSSGELRIEYKLKVFKWRESYIDRLIPLEVPSMQSNPD